MLLRASSECGFIDRITSTSANWEQQLAWHAACGANRFMWVFSPLGYCSILFHLFISLPYVYNSINAKVLGHVTFFLHYVKRRKFTPEWIKRQFPGRYIWHKKIEIFLFKFCIELDKMITFRNSQWYWLNEEGWVNIKKTDQCHMCFHV